MGRRQYVGSNRDIVLLLLLLRRVRKDELFGRGFLHNQKATMAEDPTTSLILDPSVKM